MSTLFRTRKFPDHPKRASDFMHIFKVALKNMLVLEHPRANVTLEGLYFTNTMYSRHVLFQIALFCELPAANLALISGIRMLRSAVAAAALSMRRVVVSADR